VSAMQQALPVTIVRMCLMFKLKYKLTNEQSDPTDLKDQEK